MVESNLNLQFLSSIIKTPETVIDHFDLIYTNTHQLAIKRCKVKKGFKYVVNNKPLQNKNDLKRIQELSIPPAWENVKISTVANGHLQAVGFDAKKRKQYKYHSLWHAIRNQTKFYKMVAFGKRLPIIRQQVDIDLEQKGWPKSKVLALIIRLMEETHIRIGNDQYAKRNKTYGLTTMRNRHVRLFKNTLKFEFTGKKGKKHSVTLRNKKLVHLVNKCEEIPGWELFQYYDEYGEKHNVESAMVNDYIHNTCGEIFTAKDFRTWAATVIFFEYLRDVGIAKTQNERDKNILRGYDTEAKELGNTRNVCRKYYVHPAVMHAYKTGVIKTTFDIADSLYKNGSFYSVSENAMLKLLEEYTPNFLK
ncbi:DNA topoisomerase IB [Aquimarina algicola]|uniref:DNA topoisomerase n=1 Tax=Aquimarina algicola TaxID=2589995 RepID=A0A504JCZ3_9FLAO|nr:DNA topoisomerase IB [Aquimarina algicola]TPN84450.1 DNA topoisomerase IB [Aquimarina algicola]